MAKFTSLSVWAAFVLVSLCVAYSECLLRSKIFPPIKYANKLAGSNAFKNDSALFLTPYIKEGKLEEGRKLSQVVGLPGNAPQIKSYSGYFTVNEEYNSNMFFWFFPALNGKTDVPVLLWLQGGPGGSSLFGLFVENGPFKVTEDINVLLNNYTWNKEFAVVYFDNPVGTGYSFTDNDKGYARNEVDVGRDLYEALKQFFTLFEDYRGNSFFLTGESYAGKYVPAIAHKIYTEGEAAKKVGINLQGMAIGDGLCDPANMLDYGHFLFQVGLLDELQRDHFIKEQNIAAQLIKKRDFRGAFDIFDNLLNGDLTGKPSFFTNVTGLTFYYNFLYDTQPAEFGYYDKFLAMKETRKALHVGNRPYNDGNIVEKHLVNDVMDSVKPWIEDILNAKYRTLMYSGQLDIIVAAPLTESFLKSLKWNGADKYRSANRTIYRTSPNAPTVAGYVRQADNLYQVIIRKAGHILPFDQPEIALDMITRFVTNTDF